MMLLASTERTLHSQEELIKALNLRIIKLEETIAEYKKYKEATEKGEYKLWYIVKKIKYATILTLF